MQFQNLNISRIIIHEVFRRNEDRSMQEPRYGAQLIQLDAEGRDALQLRITEALGESSHGVEMSIHDVSDASFWRLGKRVVDSIGNDAEFIQASQAVTAKLAAAQTNRIVPGGIVVVIDGTCGFPARPFMCVIKAEPHPGFIKRDNGDQLLLEYLKDLILTPQAKLYKIGAFVHADAQADPAGGLAAGWKAFLFDELITKANRLGAAQYFYETFLGLAFPSNSAFQTKQFHSLTKEFIRTAEHMDDEKRSDLINALTAYLKADQTATVQVAAFANAYFDTPELRDAYTAFMVGNEFPQQAIHKDLSEVAPALKQRKLLFGHNIKLTAPSEEFEGYIRIQSIDGEPDEDGQVPKWTQITVRDRIRDQE